MSAFQGLSAGKTCIAATIASASGVSNITGCVSGGSFCPDFTAGPGSAALTQEIVTSSAAANISGRVERDGISHLVVERGWKAFP